MENEEINAPKEVHKSSDEKYLERLEFNPELRKSFLNFFVSNFRVVLLLIGILTIAGAYSFSKLPRESNPEVKIPIAVVSTFYPGASPSDVEELVTKKLETGIAGLKDLDKVTSNSYNSVSSIVVEFNAKANLDDSIRSLRDKVTSAKSDLPADAKEPVVTEISMDDQPILTLAITGPYGGFEMRQMAEDLKDELEKIPGVREANISGGDQKEFEVAYNPEKLLFYGVSADQANQAIAATNLAIPAGNFEGSQFTYPIRSDSRVFAAEAIGAIPVGHTSDGGLIFIKDLANVSLKAIEKTAYSRLSSEGSTPEDAVTISIIKRTGGSIIDTVSEAKKTTERMLKVFPAGVRYQTTTDMAELVDRDFDQLSHDFLLTLLLVFVILFLIVGLKEAFVAGLAIPLVFFATFSVMLALGATLNFLSLFSLILALGLLVDDAIVVVSATKQYLRTGKFTPEEAVLLVLNDFKVVLTTTTLTTVWAFLPLLLSTGIMGEFIKSIPITVSITLISSLFIALMINHPLAAVLERLRMTKKFFILIELLLIAVMGLLFWTGGVLGFGAGILVLAGNIWMIVWYERGGHGQLLENKTKMDLEWQSDELIKKKLREQGNHPDATLAEKLIHGILHFNVFLPSYERAVTRMISTKKARRTTLIVVGAVFLFSLMLPATGIVQTIFFPLADFDYIYVDVRTPIGMNISETDKVARQVEEKLLRYPDIKTFSSIVGHPSPVSTNGRSGSNVASMTVTLKEAKERSKKSYLLAEDMRRDFADITGADITVGTESGGPPTGAAFEARISGEDLKVLDKVAGELEEKLKEIPGVINVDISLKDAAPEYTFTLDPVKLELNGLNAAYVGSMLRMAISGSEVSTVIQGGEEVKIVVRFDKTKLPGLEAVQNLQILNLRKQAVFLKDVAKIELKPAVDTITRIDQKRTVLLSAGADSTTNSNKILADFQSKIKTYEFPTGYSIFYGGENEQNTESVVSILQAMVIAIFLIIATLVIQFNSFRKAAIVLVTIPLALIGVFVGMGIFNVALSFPGLIGILALFGIVVKNAIILVDKMNLNIKSGIPFMDSVVDAGKSRMEAIFITSICTIFGILPVTLSNETWTSLGGAVIFGLSLSSFLTLFIVPTLFVSLIGEKDRF